MKNRQNYQPFFESNSFLHLEVEEISAKNILCKSVIDTSKFEYFDKVEDCPSMKEIGT